MTAVTNFSLEAAIDFLNPQSQEIREILLQNGDVVEGVLRHLEDELPDSFPQEIKIYYDSQLQIYLRYLPHLGKYYYEYTGETVVNNPQYAEVYFDSFLATFGAKGQTLIDRASTQLKQEIMRKMPHKNAEQFALEIQ